MGDRIEENHNISKPNDIHNRPINDGRHYSISNGYRTNNTEQLRNDSNRIQNNKNSERTDRDGEISKSKMLTTPLPCNVCNKIVVKIADLGRTIGDRNAVSTNKIDSFNKSYLTIQTSLKESIKVEEDFLKIEHDNCNKSIDHEPHNFNDPLDGVVTMINDGNDEEYQMNNKIIELNDIRKQSNDNILKEEMIEIEEHLVKIEDPLENDTNEKSAHNQTSLFVKGAKRIIDHSLNTGKITNRFLQKSKQTDRKPSNIDALQHHTNSNGSETQTCKNDENTETTKTHIIDQKHVKTFMEDEQQSKKLSIKSNPYECETCYKRFPQEHLLRKHTQFLHYLRKSYECDSCDKSFLTKRQLSSHSIEHAKRHDARALQTKTNNQSNGSITGANKSNNNQMFEHKTTAYNKKDPTFITIEIKNEVSMEETEQSPENLSDLSSPTSTKNLDKRIQEQPLKTTRNDKIENNSNNRSSNTEKLTNTDKKLSQINGIVENTEGIVSYSSTGKIVSDKPIDKDRSNLSESIDGNQTNTTITGEELFQCKACHAMFSHEDLLVTHVKSVHSNRKFYKCEICKKNFLTVRQLPSHTVEHVIHDHNLEVCTYKNPFSNDTSDKKFIYMAYLKAYSKKMALQCDICGKQFMKTTQFKRHTILHKGEKSHQCDICGKRYSERRTLRAHLRSHTGEKPYNCNKCGKKFGYKESFRRHLRSHNGVRPHQCDVCGKNFSTLSLLRRHFIVHTGEKAHQCNVCGKKFTGAGELKIHSTVHTGEQAYCCSTCGKRFSRKDNLNTHSKIHTGEKPFQCNICDKRFLYKHVLRDHLKVHSGEKSFDCNKCNVSFLQKSDLSVHMKRQHKKK